MRKSVLIFAPQVVGRGSVRDYFADTFDPTYADLSGWTSGLSPASANLLPGGTV